MPEENTTANKHQLLWYHCGRCGSLFEAEASNLGIRRCTQCGFDPNPLPKEDQKTVIPFSKSVKHVNDDQEKPNHPVRQTIRREKANPLLFRLVFVWMMLLVAIVLTARTCWREEEKIEAPAKVSAVEAMDDKENSILLENSVKKCTETLNAFLQSVLPEERSQFVWSPVDAILQMTRHQDLNPIVNVSPPRAGASQWGVVNLGDEKAIEGIWFNEDGRCFEALFRKEHDVWLIDWEHLVRYSDMPFQIFLSEDGDAEAEFRLFARERLAEERKTMSTISLVFYAPIFGRPTETGPASPEFLVQRDSPEGKLLETAFAAVKSKKRPFNAKAVNLDPEGLIRVKAKIRRSGELDARSFSIVELKACHWYSSDLPGFDIANAEAVKSQN